MEFPYAIDGFSFSEEAGVVFRGLIIGGGGNNRTTLSSSSSTFVFDSERGKIVRALVKPDPKGLKTADKALATLRNHSEKERRRKETLFRSLIPGSNKLVRALVKSDPKGCKTANKALAALRNHSEAGSNKLVRPLVKPDPKGCKTANKALAALRNHSEAERRRRERINGHLILFRSIIPGSNKTMRTNGRAILSIFLTFASNPFWQKVTEFVEEFIFISLNSFVVSIFSLEFEKRGLLQRHVLLILNYRDQARITHVETKKENT